MSSMLDQAIIDAAALREAALKNAEQAVIEKYAPKIKAAVTALLENDSPRFSRGQQVSHGGRSATVTVESENGTVGIQEMEGGKTFLVQESDVEESMEEEGIKPELEETANAPLAAIDIEQEGIQEGDQVIFEFTADDFLEEDSAKGESGLDTMADSETEKEMGAGDLATPTPGGTSAETPGSDDVVNLEENEDTTLQELLDMLSASDTGQALEEELMVDMIGNRKDGTMQTEEETLRYYQEMELAKHESTKYKEENEALNKKIEELDEGYKKAYTQNVKLKNILNTLNEKLQSTLLSNAKLLYSNRALTDASLNERQKVKIVEAINSARTVEEAKTLHETLKSAVGSTKSKGPQSLSETVQRKSNLPSMLTSKRQETPVQDNFSERMKKLAGIN